METLRLGTFFCLQLRCSRPLLALLVVVYVHLFCWIMVLLFHFITSLLRGAHDPSYCFLFCFVLFFSVFFCCCLFACFVEKVVFGSGVVVGDESQLVFWWLALARKMYQPDNVGLTCPSCYSYHKMLRVPRKSFVVLRFPVRSLRSWS